MPHGSRQSPIFLCGPAVATTADFGWRGCYRKYVHPRTSLPHHRVQTVPAVALTSGGAAGSLSAMGRWLRGLALVLLLVATAGCGGDTKEERQIWQQVKIADLAPTASDKPAKAQFYATVRMEIHAVDLPADSLERLDELWRMLSAKPIYMSSYNAFAENSFRVKFGRMEMWNDIQRLLAEADGQQAGTTVLPIANNDTMDLPIVDLPVGRPIKFVGNDLSNQTVSVGPGSLVLRIRVEPVPWARGVRKIIVYPTYTPSARSAIPQLGAIIRRHEFYFAPAAFAAQMGPGDLLVLGPDEYTGEQATLGGLFFGKPQGCLFLTPSGGNPPRYKPCVRLYILVCAGVSD